MNETIQTLLAHRSVRQFTDEPVQPDTVETLIRCAQAAASSSLYQAYTFIQVVDPDQRRALYEASGNQPWVLQAPLLLLCCADMHRAQGNFDVDDKVFGYVEQYTIAVIDAALAAQNLMVAAESLGLGGCFIGGIRNESGSRHRSLRPAPVDVPGVRVVPRPPVLPQRPQAAPAAAGRVQAGPLRRVRRREPDRQL